MFLINLKFSRSGPFTETAGEGRPVCGFINTRLLTFYGKTEL